MISNLGKFYIFFKMTGFEMMSVFGLSIYIWFLKIRYKKLGDEDNWFEINENTGDLKTVKVLDRESKFVKNDQYNVSVVATDAGRCNFLEIKYKHRIWFKENRGGKLAYFQIKIYCKKCLHYDCIVFWRPPNLGPSASIMQSQRWESKVQVPYYWPLPWTWGFLKDCHFFSGI